MILSPGPRTLSKQCNDMMSLETSLEPDTVVYGTMFTVESKDDPITILTFEIFANPLGTNIDLKIFTKSGDFIGAENDSTQWTKIVDTSLFPAREGRGTIIPTNQFQNVTMEGNNELRAFFVSLKTADLRYMRDEKERDVGEAFISDNFLSIKSGIGISEYGFGNQIVPSRLFTGIIHYSHKEKCADSSSQATILYSFYAQAFSAGSMDEISYILDYSLTNILSTTLSAFRDEFKIAVESTTCAESALKGECDEERTDITNCTVVDCQVAVNHLNTISQGNLKYMLLQKASNVTEWMHQGSMEIEYVGMETMTASILVTIEGIPTNDDGGSGKSKTMNDKQKKYTEDVMTSFLEEKTMSQSNAIVLGANITSQRGPDGNDNRFLKQTNSIVLSVDVFAAYVPPYTGNVQFDMIIISQFRSQESDFIYDITTSHYLPGSIVEGKSGEFFKGITKVLVTSPTTPGLNVTNGGTPNEASGDVTSLYGLDSFVFVGICCGVIILMCAWICICTKRSKSSPIEGDGIILVDSTGQRRNRSSVLFMNIDLSSITKKKNQKVGEAVTTNDNPLMSTVHSRNMDDKSSHASRHEVSHPRRHYNEYSPEPLSRESASGMHGSNHNSNLNTNSSHGSREQMVDHGRMVRKQNQERLGHVSNLVTHSSNHSRSLDIKSTHDSGMYGSNHNRNLNAKSSHGSRAPIVDHGRMVRKNSQERLGYASNDLTHGSNHSRSLDIKSTHASRHPHLNLR